MKFNKLLPVLLFLVNASVLASPTAKITLKVMDEQGNPISGANAGIGLMMSKGKGQGWGTNSSRLKGLTDSDGLFSGEGTTQPYLSFSATKEGYYGSGGEFTSFTGVSGFLGFRKYEPWNPTVELLLKKIINPIPMYAVWMSAGQREEYPDIPVLDRFVSFDLEANDWVVPHGLGIQRDFLFKVEVKHAVSNSDYDVTLSLKFSNPGDGLIKYTPDISKGKSMLRFPHHAPVTGYEPEYVKQYKRTPDVRKVRTGSRGLPEFETNYFFRVRTEQDKDGNVIGGLYGKIHGQIQLGNFAWLHSDKPYVRFDYYLNPNNNDTNIEYDPEKNLFKGVPDRKKVSEP